MPEFHSCHTCGISFAPGQFVTEGAWEHHKANCPPAMAPAAPTQLDRIEAALAGIKNLIERQALLLNTFDRRLPPEP